jgi:single-strand DNA-binding protein
LTPWKKNNKRADIPVRRRRADTAVRLQEGIIMASYNRVILVGNLTRDPEIRYLQSGMAVADIGLAVNDRRKNANGEWVEETTFVDVTFWGRTAEVAGEYLSKGSPVLVEGRLKLDRWESKDGQKQSKMRVVCERMQMLGGKGEGRAAAGAAAGRPAARQNSEYSQSAPPEDFDVPPEAPADGDIPF